MDNYYGRRPIYSEHPLANFTGNGSQTAYTLPYNPGHAAAVIVFIAGVFQPASTYTISALTLTFSVAPVNGAAINIVYLGLKSSVITPTWNIPCVQATGTVNAIEASYTPPITALTDNLMVGFRVTGSSSSTTPTFKPAATLDAKTVVDMNGNALSQGDLNGIHIVQYKSTEDKWFLVSSTAQRKSRYTLADAATVTPDLTKYDSFKWTVGGSRTLGFPTIVPECGTWYIDATIDSTGGYSLTLGSGYNLIPGYYFNGNANKINRIWLTIRSTTIIDVSIEQLN